MLSCNTVFLSRKNVFYYFFYQLWFAMCTQIITDTHITLWVTHKNNPNVRQIITLARSGLFMEYCCLVLSVCVWGVGERVSLSNWWSSRQNTRGQPEALISSLIILLLYCDCCCFWGQSSILDSLYLEKTCAHRYYLKGYCEFPGYDRGVWAYFKKNLAGRCQVAHYASQGREPSLMGSVLNRGSGI